MWPCTDEGSKLGTGMNNVAIIRRSKDAREEPAYTIPEAAHYLRLPEATLRSWVVGRPYPVKSGRRYFQPVILMPEPGLRLLSFINLVEAHVLSAIRREHRVALQKVRDAAGYFRRHMRSEHPFAEHKIETDGVDLFVRKLGNLINVSENGQLAMREVLDAHLKRIERDSAGHAVRLYVFTRNLNGDNGSQEPKVVCIDPAISFGRPVLSGTGIPTAVIANRYKAGESIDQLAADYGRQRPEIEDAIRCELPAEAA